MKEIKSKKSFLTLLITTCLILATTTFVTDISAEGESCLNNLNAIFLSNAEELMEVQATRLVNDELNTAAENWTLEELNTFLEDLEDDQGEDEDDQGEDEDEELEFNPGYLSADQTFTAMVSYGFIPEGSRDLEAYRELYHDPYSLEGNVSTMRNFQVLKQYDFIPSSISQSDFRKLGGRTGLIIRGFEYLIPIPAPTVTINCGYIHLEGPPDDPNCYIDPIDRHNIDVGDGDYIRIEVDYYMDCPGAADDGYVDISCQGVSDSEHTGTHKEGTLTITLWFDDGETFNVKLHLIYWDWWHGDVVEEITLYSHCSTKEYDPPNSPPDRPDRPDGPTPIGVGEEHTYTSSATDPDGDQVYLKFDWGDGYDTAWLGPKTSGSTFSAKHSWSEQDYYDITCIAKDYPYGEPSPWSYPLRISVPQPNP